MQAQAGSEIAEVILQYSSKNCYGDAFYESALSGEKAMLPA